MTSFNKFTSIMIAALIAVFMAGHYIKFEELPEKGYGFFAVVLLLPVAVSQALLFLYRNNVQRNMRQWIPNILSILALFLMLIVQIINFEDLSKDQQRDLEQERIQKSVSKWIRENSANPSSYVPFSFEYYTQAIYPYPPYMDKYEPMPLKYFLEIYSGQYDYAYYFTNHKFLLKNKNNTIDTIWACFQLTPDKNIINVRTQSEAAMFYLPQAAYDWRKKYGNEKRNLELEINGHTDTTYHFFEFDKDGVFGKIVPYSNSYINGPVHYFRNNNNIDTAAIITYRNGIRNGVVMEICSNGVRGFTGMNVNGTSTGLCTFRYCSGQKSSEGMRLNSIEVGTWKYWDENGNLIRTKDYGNETGEER